MRSWMAAVLCLAMIGLSLVALFAALDVAKSSLERPTCQRNNFTDPQRPLPRIGQNCR